MIDIDTKESLDAYNTKVCGEYGICRNCHSLPAFTHMGIQGVHVAVCLECNIDLNAGDSPSAYLQGRLDDSHRH